MSKRVAGLGTFAVALLAANPPGAAKAWDCCYDHPCHTRYYTNCYYQCDQRAYARYPRYAYHRYYEEYPRRYARYGDGYDAYDRSYYRYYGSYRYEDDYAW